jgi:ATP-binding cassette, subfamily B, beta-glucan exporter
MGFLSASFALWASTYTFRAQEPLEKYHSDLSAHYIDTYSNILAVKSFTLREARMYTLNVLLDERLRLQYPVLKWWGLIISFSQIATVIITIGVIALGSYLYLDGLITLGQIVMFIGYSTLFLSSIESIMWVFDGFFWRTPATAEFFETLETRPSVIDAKDAKKLPRVKGDIRFEDVGFSYESDREILKKINFSIEAGKKVAFVGHTGSGKTTATNLILRFYDIQSGRILIDGMDIRTVTEDSLRANIGVVFQDNSLFDATIRENILLGEKKVSKKRLEEIVEKSHIKEFIARLPNGLDTLVGERGVKLSGGERQRLAIARAFLKDAPILILDEATSALDAETERYLQESFEELMEDRTTIIIAHRLSTIRKADTIFVFRDGEIVEEGSYTTLVEKK